MSLDYKRFAVFARASAMPILGILVFFETVSQCKGTAFDAPIICLLMHV